VKTIHVQKVINAVKGMCIEANYLLGPEEIAALDKGIKKEESLTGKEVLKQIRLNADIAKNEDIPICQDTGLAVFFVEIGNDVFIEGGSLTDAINEGVRQGYKDGFLRKSVLDPFARVNTGDNTPVIIHYDYTTGDRLKIILDAKGGGSENMSRLQMLKPSDGRNGVKNFAVETVKMAGGNPCPPLVVGVGVGGNFEKCALLAKKALLRPLGTPHENPEIAALEKEILEEVNNLGVGPQGLGGRVTALAVHVEYFPCHIASLPAAVNLDCHVHRHKEINL
jgi:fumarate hydratase subunit alpha